MGYEIKRVAVLGAGVMGQGIAAHLANAGIPSVLYDIVPEGAEDRRKLARDGIAHALAHKPALFYRKEDADRIRPANYEDDADLLASCDWIVEVVVERLDIKRKVYDWVARHRRPGSIVSSNTSGLSLAAMAEGMPEEMRRHFLVTHFFNPVRYMRLLELVAGRETLREVTRAIAAFGEERLGKGIVYAKDTPNFIANRIGTYGICAVFRAMERHELTVPEVDAIFGKAMGRPKSAVFRTADLVGLDTLVHVLRNVYDNCPDDEEREIFRPPEWLLRMVEEGALGAKSGRGFYEKRVVDGKKVIFYRDLATGEYRPTEKVRFDSLGAARRTDGPAESLKVLLQGRDRAALAAWEVTADTLAYASRRIPEIADDVVNVDRAMRWGFGWEIGVFEGWDAIGVRSATERMQADGRSPAKWVLDMLEAGRERFYERDADATPTYWTGEEARPVPFSPRWILLDELRERGAVVEHNLSASLLDLGDGVACLEFHSKMNAIDDDIIALYGKALDQLEAGRWEALVVGNQQGPAFCAGANLFMVLMASMQGAWSELERQVRALQDVLQRALYSERPVVTAPRGLALGGGCEIAMQASAARPLGELYMGLVEVGVGVIPAGGGCKEVLARYLGDLPRGAQVDPNPLVQKAFENIGTAKVSRSVEEARDLGYVRPHETPTLDPDALIHDAKALALGMRAGGWRPRRPRTFAVPGRSGIGALEEYLYQMHEGGFITDHDVVVGRVLARVLTGGDVPAGTVVTEQHILDLEREAFLELCGTPGTQARMQHFLQTGKPLRN